MHLPERNTRTMPFRNLKHLSILGVFLSTSLGSTKIVAHDHNLVFRDVVEMLVEIYISRGMALNNMCTEIILPNCWRTPGTQWTDHWMIGARRLLAPFDGGLQGQLHEVWAPRTRHINLYIATRCLLQINNTRRLKLKTESTWIISILIVLVM